MTTKNGNYREFTQYGKTISGKILLRFVIIAGGGNVAKWVMCGSIAVVVVYTMELIYVKKLVLIFTNVFSAILTYRKMFRLNMKFDNTHLALLGVIIVLTGILVYLLTKGNTTSHYEPPPAPLLPPPPVKKDGEMALFFSHNCPHCVNMMTAWNDACQNLQGKVKTLEFEASSGVPSKHGITGFPSVRYYPDGLANPQKYVEYQGNRSKDSLVKFALSGGREM
jgi:hypothetical protein